MAYSQQVLDRFHSVLKDPIKHSVGKFDPEDPNVATGMTGAPSCGDVMRLQLKLDGDFIEDVKFKTYGCGSAIASSTLFVELQSVLVLVLNNLLLLHLTHNQKVWLRSFF